MHIPDHYLSPQTCAVMTAFMAPVWAVSVARVKKKKITSSKIPLIGISAAFTFIIMMFNIPLPGGTTGHATGAALAGILIGPYAASLAVSVSLLIQALLFGDGGILAFGANCFNMAFVIPFAGYYLYWLFKRLFSSLKGKEFVSTFLAGYISLNLAALMASIEFGIQPLLFKDAAGMPLYCPYPLQISIPAMMLPHLLVAGIAEGLVTAGVLVFLRRTISNTVEEFPELKLSPIYALLMGLVLLSPVGLLAEGTAWGEWGKEELLNMFGKIPEGIEKGFEFFAPFRDYTLFGVPEVAGYVISAIIGVAAILIIFKIAGFFWKKGGVSK